MLRLSQTTDVKQIIKIVGVQYGLGNVGMLPAVVYYGATKKGNIDVCEDGGKITGFVLSRYMKKTGFMRLIQIVKTDECSMRGKNLIKTVYDRAYKNFASAVVLDVKKHNEKAINFYKKEGFVVSGEKDDDLFTMAKDITGRYYKVEKKDK